MPPGGVLCASWGGSWCFLEASRRISRHPGALRLLVALCGSSGLLGPLLGAFWILSWVPPGGSWWLPVASGGTLELLGARLRLVAPVASGRTLRERGEGVEGED